MLRQPSQKMYSYLAAARQKNNDNYKAASQALNNYLETTLQTPVAGLTRPQLAQHLRERDLAEALIKRVKHCLTQSEMGRYGPVTEDAGWSLMVETDELLFELDEAFGQKS